jgi:hypothetical protein
MCLSLLFVFLFLKGSSKNTEFDLFIFIKNLFFDPKQLQNTLINLSIVTKNSKNSSKYQNQPEAKIIHVVIFTSLVKEKKIND